MFWKKKRKPPRTERLLLHIIYLIGAIVHEMDRNKLINGVQVMKTYDDVKKEIEGDERFWY